jgi:hypothetical protein
MPLNSHHRQNDDIGGFGTDINIPATAQWTEAFRKLHDDSHAPPPPTAEPLFAPAIGSVRGAD